MRPLVSRFPLGLSMHSVWGSEGEHPETDTPEACPTLLPALVSISISNQGCHCCDLLRSDSSGTGQCCERPDPLGSCAVEGLVIFQVQEYTVQNNSEQASHLMGLRNGCLGEETTLNIGCYPVVLGPRATRLVSFHCSERMVQVLSSVTQRGWRENKSRGSARKEYVI